MTGPVVARAKGYYYEVKAGKKYFWCSCGRSATQPFCDGSHQGTGFMPVLYRAKQDEDVIFCGCKHTGSGPFCDGAHNNLPGGYSEDDPNSPANRAVAAVTPGNGPEVALDGQCYVFSTERAALTRKGALAYCAVINPARGALYQSQFYAEITEGTSPVIMADDRHTVLFITEGEGTLEISGRSFNFLPRTGFYVRPSEAYRISMSGPAPVKLFISTGPVSDDLIFADIMPTNFEQDFPNRQADIDPSQRHSMASRFFQMLINREHGSTVVTQFIGNIPLSKSEAHQHLYEEAIIVLNGAGVMWTERTKTAVKAGDVLFLPRKQVHSLQCTVEGGLDVVGVIYPGDNPSINY